MSNFRLAFNGECRPSQGRGIIAPIVSTVLLNESARKVISQVVDRKVNRLFGVDERNVPVGVISALDVFRRIQSA